VSALYAACFTVLCSDQATAPRQTRMLMPKKPRMAPTMMKMVPSGRLDFCMKGAFAVFGTIWVGTPTPAMVGNVPVSEKEESEGASPTDIDDAAVPLEVDELPVVMLGALLTETLEA
jgi:hypothetical protein